MRVCVRVCEFNCNQTTIPNTAQHNVYIFNTLINFDMLQIYCLKKLDAAKGYLLSFYCVAIFA